MSTWWLEEISGSHDLLTKAGILRSGPGDDGLPLVVRVSLLIDERNNLRTELENMRESERIANRSGYAYRQNDALVDD